MMRDRKTERALIRGKDVERERPITATLVTGDSTFMRRSDSNDALRGLSTSYAGFIRATLAVNAITRNTSIGRWWKTLSIYRITP
jgi:hypothetical protein